jgi:hypothetical protein
MGLFNVICGVMEHFALCLGQIAVKCQCCAGAARFAQKSLTLQAEKRY